MTLGGGGTDLPSFYKKHGGFVVSMAIDKHCYITFKPNVFDSSLILRYSENEKVKNISELKNTRAREVLLRHGITSAEICSIADLPTNTGLGSSGSFLVGMINTLREYKRISQHPTEIAEEACDIEINKLNEPVGKQDQYIASYGGLKTLTIDTYGNVNVKNVNVSHTNFSLFLSNIQVYYLNVQRNASDVLKEQSKMKSSTEDLLLKIKDYGYQTLDIIENQNFDQYGLLMHDYWELKKKLSSNISINTVDILYEELRKNYNVLGGKIIGAGGGGFFMVYVYKNHKKLEEYMNSIGYSKLEFSVDYNGSKILGNYI
jgi:D-glycero-alpha-D-manno-heptose-7-phosphate kinase